MLVLPVIDLMHGVVVRGVGGRRDEYRPIDSRLCRDPSPASVARAFAETFGLRTAYVADLDAIAGAAPAWDEYAAVMAEGFELWVDAGIDGPDQGRELAAFAGRRLARVIVGLESLADAQSLPALVDAVSPERLVFSLDLKQGEPLVRAEAWRDLDAIGIARAAAAAGVRRMIVLDLADVGAAGGTRTIDLCRTLRGQLADVELTAGGGVRGIDDLRRLAEAGCNAALVASALHDLRLSRSEIEEASLF